MASVVFQTYFRDDPDIIDSMNKAYPQNVIESRADSAEWKNYDFDGTAVLVDVAGNPKDPAYITMIGKESDFSPLKSRLESELETQLQEVTA